MKARPHRSVPAHVVELVGALQAKGIGRKVLTGGTDTTIATGRLVFGIFATFSEFECDLIHERTMAGLAAARARGRTGRRPRLMTRVKLRMAVAMMADRPNAAAELAEQLGVSTARSTPTWTARAGPSRAPPSCSAPDPRLSFVCSLTLRSHGDSLRCTDRPVGKGGGLR